MKTPVLAHQCLSLALLTAATAPGCAGGTNSGGPESGLGGVATATTVRTGGAGSSAGAGGLGGVSGRSQTSTGTAAFGSGGSAATLSNGGASSGSNSTNVSQTGGVTAIGGNSNGGGATARGGAATAGGNGALGGTTSASVGTQGGALTKGGATASGGMTNGSGTMAKGGTAGSSTAIQGGTSPKGGTTGSGGVTNGGGTTSTATTSSSLCPGATRTIVVAADGSGAYKTVQAAINSISSSNSQLVQVAVTAGTYSEQVTVNKPFVCLTGASATSTIITYAGGTNIVTGGTVVVTGNDFSAANITFQNNAGNGAGQAVALRAYGLRQQFSNCRFVSYQDTLYVDTGTQYFKNCYIQGDTDYIFGDAKAVFENCTMNNVAEGTAVTAPRTPQSATYGLVFIGGSLTASPTTSTVRANHVYLGRPWGPYAAAAFINVAMGAHINADGWTTMSGNTLANTRFSEFGSTGAGANATNATRAPRQLSATQAANFTVKNVLSPWVPTYSQ